MKITWFGHSCFRIDTGRSSILIDPFLTGNATFEDAGIPLHQVTKGVTHVALTHGHEDHTGDTVRICKETDAQLIAVHELAIYMAAQGVEKIDPGNTGGTLHHGDFDLSFVPAWHSPRGSSTGARSISAPVAGWSLRRARGQDRLPYGRHRDLLRHGADQRNLRARRSASCRSATATPWAPRPPRWPASASSSSS